MTSPVTESMCAVIECTVVPTQTMSQHTHTHTCGVNLPDFESKNRIYLSSCAVTISGSVGWDTTLLICVRTVPSNVVTRLDIEERGREGGIPYVTALSRLSTLCPVSLSNRSVLALAYDTTIWSIPPRTKSVQVGEPKSIPEIT